MSGSTTTAPGRGRLVPVIGLTSAAAVAVHALGTLLAPKPGVPHVHLVANGHGALHLLAAAVGLLAVAALLAIAVALAMRTVELVTARLRTGRRLVSATRATRPPAADRSLRPERRIRVAPLRAPPVPLPSR